MLFALISLTVSRLLLADNDERSFLGWMRSQGYFFTGDEFHFRFGIFLQNLRRVQEFNKGAHNFKVGLNKFSAHTPSEYRALLGLLGAKDNSLRRHHVRTTGSAPRSTFVDWREKGVVNAVKNQGSCGSCWSFSVVAAMESQYAIVKSRLFDLSEQNLVDCATTCYGCGGGWQTTAYDYVLESQGGLWMKQSDYPYTAVEGTCQFDSAKGVCKFSSYFLSTETADEDELAASCEENGVVSIGIDAGLWGFQHYTGGIFDDPGCTTLFTNHAVAIVGFGVEDGTKYWIVRNSWGPDWGEQGYIRMIRGKDNYCGIANLPVIPVVAQ